MNDFGKICVSSRNYGVWETWAAVIFMHRTGYSEYSVLLGNMHDNDSSWMMYKVRNWKPHVAGRSENCHSKDSLFSKYPQHGHCYLGRCSGIFITCKDSRDLPHNTKYKQHSNKNVVSFCIVMTKDWPSPGTFSHCAVYSSQPITNAHFDRVTFCHPYYIPTFYACL